ncbi:MAG: hydroxysqualene dehydroxylase HpnE [Rhodospirillales bacterium]|nr:hydroxysqualene dehydroxylase HpnE [Rhodospirillales bacterium]
MSFFYTPPTLHIIGAGLSGLATAIRGSRTHRIALYESATQAGGRCRSFYDKTLGEEVDNGSHLMLGAYNRTLEYLHEIDAQDTLTTHSPATFPFVNLKNGSNWALHFNRGLIPYWLFDTSRRVPKTKLIDYLRDLNLIRKAGKDKTVAEAFIGRSSPLIEPLWRPLTLSMLNTDLEEASASILWAALIRTLIKGEKACRPLLPKTTLGATFIEPALEHLKARRATISYKTLLKNINSNEGHITSLEFAKNTVKVAPEDSVVLAVSARRAAKLLPELPIPMDHNSISSLHFRVPNTNKMLGEAALLGIVEGTAQWLFHRQGMLSVTISNSAQLDRKDKKNFANEIWQEVIKATGSPDAPLPDYRIIKEKRATFAQTPGQIALRPGTQTSYDNLYLAGDWTDTGLPATIEGAILSGFKAIKLMEKNRKKQG